MGKKLRQYGCLLKEKLAKIEEYIFAIGLIYMTGIKYVLFSMGMLYEENIVEKIFSYAAYLIFFLMVAVAVWKTIKYKRVLRRTMALTTIFLLYIIVAFAVALIQNTSSLPKVFDIISKNILLCWPFFFLGLLQFKECNEQDTFFKIYKLQKYLYPVIIGYCLMALFNINPFYGGNSLGFENYYIIGYGLLTVFMVNIITFVEYNKKNLFLIIIIWLDILASGTRGAIICGVCFLLLYTVYRIWNRKTWKKIILNTTVCLFLFGVVLLILPPGFRSVERFHIFIEGLKEHKFVTSTSQEENLEKELESELISRDSVEDDITDDTIEKGENSNSINVQKPMMEYISDRGELFQVAINEIRENNIFVMRPLQFQIKYNNYPHNIVLEFLLDNGVVIGGSCLLVILGGLLYLLYLSNKRYEIGLMLMIFLVYGIKLMVSGSYWTETMFFYSVGYMLCAFTENSSKENKSYERKFIKKNCE